jgi:hypothetical protein
MAQYKMLRNAHGSPDDVKVQHYAKDEAYELPDELAAVFVKEGLASPEMERKPKMRKEQGDQGR